MPWLRRLRLAGDGNLTLGTVLERVASARSGPLVEQPEVADGGRTESLNLDVGGAADLVSRMAGGLARQVAVGDRVVVATPNGYEQLLWCLAASRAGAIAVPVNPALTDAEVDHIIGDAGAAVVVGHDDVELGDLLHPVSVDPAGVAAIFYTSGTTGTPKGVELTHRGLLNGLRRAALWGIPGRRDEAVVALPVAHIMGFSTLLGLAVAGIPTYVVPRFRPDDVLDALESRRATVFVGVPAMYRMLLEAGAESRDLKSVRLWASGADVMPDELAARFQSMGATATLPMLGWSLGDASFAQGYGLVETGGGVAASLRTPFIPWSVGGGVGLPLPGYRFKVMAQGSGPERAVGVGEVGELWVKGPGVLHGYRGAPEATAEAVTEDGWLRTGDLVRRGMLGSVAFAGRSKHVIKRGGYSVYAVEVETVLETHPDVTAAAVVGLPDIRDGEVPVAAVTLVDRAEVTGPELVSWAAGQLATYKSPVWVEVVDELPRTATEKVRRDEVQRRLSAIREGL